MRNRGISNHLYSGDLRGEASHKYSAFSIADDIMQGMGYLPIGTRVAFVFGIRGVGHQ